MITVDQALALVLQHARPLQAVKISSSEALGFVLASQIASDIDSPPHDKSMVDGYAVTAADLARGKCALKVLEEVTAGQTPNLQVVAGAATRIMTGAPIPAGAEAVVMVERTELIEKKSGQANVLIDDPKARSGQHIMPQGESMRAGQKVLSAGSPLRPIEIGLLAEVGRDVVSVYPRPSVAVLATGDELVDPAEFPRPGKIRNSNGPMIQALVSRAGGGAVDLGIARDREDEMRRLINRGLQEDVLVLSGGVSAGVLDLVPQMLAAAGVEQIFHKVRLRPGKPLWFGVLASERGEKLVFGLPGNPVSSLVCFELFVRPALAKMSGGEGVFPRETVSLAKPHRQRGDRPTYHPAAIHRNASGEKTIQTLNWRGSADLRTLADADCLAYFPPGDREYASGESIEIVPLCSA